MAKRAWQLFVLGAALIFSLTMELRAQWSDLSPGVQADFHTVHFTSAQNGYLLSDSLLLKTSDGGDSWTTLLINDSIRFTSMWFNANNVGYVSGLHRFSPGDGLVYKTIDGGASFGLLDQAPTIRSLDFVNAQLGYGSGYTFDQIWVTSDGGATWELGSIPFSTTSFATKVFARESDELFLMVPGDSSFRGVQGFQTDIGGGQLFGCLETANLTDFEMLNNGHAMAVGEDGAVFYKFADCNTWQPVISPVSTDLYGVSLVNNTTAFVAGASGQVMRTTDGGQTWIALPSVGNGVIRDVHFLDPNVGFAVGNEGVLMKTENSGGVQIVGVDDVTTPAATLSVYPNPAREQVTLRWEEPLRQPASVRVLNALGQPVWSNVLPAGTTLEAFDVSGLSPGLYMVWLEDDQQSVTHRLLIVD